MSSENLAMFGCAARLWRDRRGAVLPMLAAFTIPAIGAIGSGIDAARIYMTKSQLQAGVDAAALAGARAFAVTDDTAKGREKQVDAYFYGNFPPGYLQVQNLKLTRSFSTNKGINVTTVEATADLPLTFMQVLGFTTQPVKAVARAELQPRPLEVMVVLDNTGSMKANLPKDANNVVKTRMTATKDAAKSFVNILYQGAETRQELALGFVMYDITVNVGHLLTKWNTSSVRQLAGFNDSYMQQRGNWPTNPLAWKGCVLADDSVKDIDTSYSTPEPGAWDVVRSLPGEGAHPPVTPYFIPPFWVPKLKKGSAKLAETANRSGEFYMVDKDSEPAYNLYRLLNAEATNWALEQPFMANSPYRRAFYRYYLGLNESATTVSEDVITRTDDTFYNPLSDKWDFVTQTGTPFKIHYDRVPNFEAWKTATQYSIDPLGGSKDDKNKNRTEPPSPNWQCPEEAEPVVYGKPKSYWTDTVIGQKNGAIYPANGTLHHAGLLWGYRLLVRDDAFPRSNPTNEEAKRALIFMTDGETALTPSWKDYTDRTFTFYGNYADAPISAKSGDLLSQSERRFSKTCASLQAEPNPPKVYIIALTTQDQGTLNMFERCAPGRVYRTSDTATLKAAFDDIATELVDLHLTK